MEFLCGAIFGICLTILARKIIAVTKIDLLILFAKISDKLSNNKKQ